MKTSFIKFIRGFITVFCFAFFGIGALVVRYCIFPFQKTKIENYETLQKSWQFFVKMLEFLKIIKLNVQDIEKLKNIKNSIIVSTHPSFIDILILLSIIPHTTCFVAKKLSNNPFFRGIVNLLFILEGQPVEKWTQQACQMLDNGLNIIIFPMGTRHRKNEFPKIRRGAAAIAFKSHKNIIAIKMDTSSDFLQVRQPIYEAGEKEVVYSIGYKDSILSDEYFKKYPDEVTFKTEITKKIKNLLYE